MYDTGRICNIRNSEAAKRERIQYPIDVSTLNHCYKYLSVPPQSIAQKWLRETQNIHICVYNCACGYGYEISKADNGTHITGSVYEGPNDGGKWDIYEALMNKQTLICN